MILLGAGFTLVWILLIAALLRIRREEQALEARLPGGPGPR